MKFGLKDSVIEKINSVLAKYPRVQMAILYGSRAKGNFRNGSDIDLVLEGDGLTLANSVYPILNEFDDLLLPYSFDLAIKSQINNVDLLHHIDRVGKIFYQKSRSDAVSNNDNATVPNKAHHP